LSEPDYYTEKIIAAKMITMRQQNQHSVINSNSL